MSEINNGIELKVCRTCGRGLSISNFNKGSKYGRGGYAATCKACRLIAQQAWRAKNPDYMSRYMSRYYQSNHDYFIARSRAWRTSNPERQATLCAEWRKKNPDRQKILSQKWAKNNPENILKRQVITTIAQSIFKKTGVLPTEIPNDLIQAKIAHIRVKRLLKEKMK